MPQARIEWHALISSALTRSAPARPGAGPFICLQSQNAATANKATKITKSEMRCIAVPNPVRKVGRRFGASRDPLVVQIRLATAGLGQLCATIQRYRSLAKSQRNSLVKVDVEVRVNSQTTHGPVRIVRKGGDMAPSEHLQSKNPRAREAPSIPSALACGNDVHAGRCPRDSHVFDGPLRWGASSRLETMPSKPIRDACSYSLPIILRVVR
jgi:hypothetical protein